MLLLLDPTPPSLTPTTRSCFSLPLGESAIKTTGPMQSIFLAISLSMTLIARGFCGSLCPWRIRRARRRLLLYGRLENASGIKIILEYMKLFVSCSNGALKLLAWIEMEFNYDDTSFSNQFHVNGRHLACSDQLAPFAGENLYESVPAKALLSDVENDSSGYHKEFINVTADLYDNLQSGLSGNPTLAWMAGNTSEVILSDNGKSSLSDDESSLQVSKHLKQVDHHLQASSPEEIHSSASKSPSPSSTSSIEALKDSVVDTTADEFPGEAKSSHLLAQYTSHENLNSPARLTLHSNFSGNSCQVSECNHDNEIFSPHKEVVSMLDPFGQCNRDEIWKNVVNMSLNCST